MLLILSHHDYFTAPTSSHYEYFAERPPPKWRIQQFSFVRINLILTQLSPSCSRKHRVGPLISYTLVLASWAARTSGACKAPTANASHDTYWHGASLPPIIGPNDLRQARNIREFCIKAQRLALTLRLRTMMHSIHS